MGTLIRRNDGTSGISPLRRYLPVALALFAGAVLSVILFVIVRNWEKGRMRGTLYKSFDGLQVFLCVLKAVKFRSVEKNVILNYMEKVK